MEVNIIVYTAFMQEEKKFKCNNHVKIIQKIIL